MKKHKLISLTLAEFSAVRRPAQEGATIDLTKSDDRVVLMKSEAIVEKMTCACGTTSHKSKHCPDCGTAMTTKSAPPLNPENPPMLTEQEKAERADLEKRLAKSQKFGLLTDIQKAHYGRLQPDAQAAFLEMTDAQRAEEAKPVYTSEAGQVFTKADDVRVVEIAKAADTDRKSMAARLEKADAQILKAEVEADFRFLPGTIDERIALVSAAKGIKDEKARDAAISSLKAHNALLGKSFGRQGTGATPVGGIDSVGAETKLDTMAKAIAVEKKISYEDAYVQACESPEGAALYKSAFSTMPS